MEKSYVGGQAVIEGVMMKAQDKIAVAVRDPKGSIKIKKLKPAFSESKIPFIRGIVNLVFMLYIGYKSLEYSSSIQTGEKESSSFAIVISVLIAIVFAVLLFKFIPLAIASLLTSKFSLNNFVFNLIDGFSKILIFVLYVYLISLFSDIKRVFQYHGAEHKAVACYEHGKKLTVENVRKFSTLHKRCGTTFIFLVLFVSIFVYVFIPADYSFWAKLGLRLLLLPVIASLSYEILRLGARFNFLSFLTYPGLLIQKITTREPDNAQILVAIKALKAVL